ncbi:MAG: hypothetical protein VKJ66_07310 [Synechococcus sp.]|nr:hypothetical protein [Synechococcus sp.]
MEDLLQNTLDSATAEAALVAGSKADAMVFLLIAALGLLMALVYVPIRLFLTITARRRRLRLLQRIRRLRDDLVQPIQPDPATSGE